MDTDNGDTQRANEATRNLHETSRHTDDGTYEETTEGQHEVSFGRVYERLSRTSHSDARGM